MYFLQQYNKLMSRQNYEQQLRREILEIQNQIYDLETFYLQNTRESGNLLKGFENYLSGKAPRNQAGKKSKIQNFERLFSLTSVKSKTSEGLEESYIMDNKESSQMVPNKRRSRPNYHKGKSYNHNDESLDNSASADNMYSMEESSVNVKNRKKQKKIGKSSKGIRRV